MENYIFETKNYTIGLLGEFEYEKTGYICERYVVEVKGIDCLFIIFEFVDDELVYKVAWDQDDETPEGQELTDFTHKIAELIENDLVEIVKFMNRYM